LLVHGPTILVEVGFNEALFQPGSVPPVPQTEPSFSQNRSLQPDGGQGTPSVESNPTMRTSSQTVIQATLALVDTGAGTSCIDDNLAISLNLPLVDVVRVGGAGGAHNLNLYLAKLSIPQLNYSKAGKFIGAKLSQGGQIHGALIGRDFLSDMLVVYDGTAGRIKLSV